MATAAIPYRQNEVDLFLWEVFGPEQKQAETFKSTIPLEPLDLDDEEILTRAANADNCAKFSKLNAGNWKGDYSSRSEADLAYCGMLAFSFGRDKERMDRVFRRSGLYRKKWDREDYRNPTLDKAIAECREVYKPPKAKTEPTNGASPETEWPEGFTTERPSDTRKKDATNQEPFCLEDAILDVDSFLAVDIPEKESLLHPWLKDPSCIEVTAWRGVGKTQIGVAICDSITKGKPLGPWECRKSVNCLYLDGEMAAPDMKRRLSDLGTGGRVSKLFVYSDAYAHSLGQVRANLLNERWREGLYQFMLKNGIKLWVCDNIASLTPGIDENSKAEWDQVNQYVLKLRFSGISTILIHHEGKQGTQRGTSAREDNLDVCLSLRRPPDYTPDQGARFIIHFTKSRIPLEDLSLITDHEFQLTRMPGDIYEWTWTDAKKKSRDTILRLLDEGIAQKDIATQLGCVPSWVSQVKSEAIRDGYMTKAGKLTQKGFTFLYGDEN